MSTFAKPAKDQPTRPIVANIIYRFSQFAGLFPYQIPWHSSTSPPPIKIFPAIWAAVLFFAQTYCFLSWCLGIFRVYQEQLYELEFFAIISFIFKVLVYLQGPVLCIMCIVRGRSLPALINRLAATLAMVDGSVTKHRCVFQVLVVLWAGLYTSLCLVSFVFAFNPIGHVVNKMLEDALRQYLHYIGPKMPDFVFTLIIGLAFCLVLSAETFPACFIVIALREIKGGYRSINNQLLTVVLKNGQTPHQTVAGVAGQRDLYRRLQCHVSDMDAVFSPLVLIAAIREFVGFIAVVSVLLQVASAREEESRLQAASRMIDDATKNFVYGFGLLGLSNMIYKACVAVSVHEEAQQVRVNLKKLLALSPFPAVQQECAAFVAECELTDGAISSGGFFYLTKQSLSGLAQLTITYSLLIYQTRDTKQDMAQLPTKADLIKRREMRLSEERITDRMQFRQL